MPFVSLLLHPQFVTISVNQMQISLPNVSLHSPHMDDGGSYQQRGNKKSICLSYRHPRYLVQHPFLQALNSVAEATSEIQISVSSHPAYSFFCPFPSASDSFPLPAVSLSQITLWKTLQITWPGIRVCDLFFSSN